MYEASHCSRVSAHRFIAPSAFAQTFRTDDPVWVDNDTAVDVKGIAKHKLNDQYDFLIHTFGKPGDRTPRPALNINTLGEVPDSSWFHNRHGIDAHEHGRSGPWAQHWQRTINGWALVCYRSQDRRHHSGIPHPRRTWRCVLHQVRSAAKPGDGDRSRSDFDQVLSCHGLQRPRKLPGILYTPAASRGSKGNDNGCDRPRTAS